jgi:hypothetical protein
MIRTFQKHECKADLEVQLRPHQVYPLRNILHWLCILLAPRDQLQVLQVICKNEGHQEQPEL